MDTSINIEMRKKLKTEILPDVIKFTEAVFPFVREYEMDRLDTISIRDIVLFGNEKQALFKLTYDPYKKNGTAECSISALSADEGEYNANVNDSIHFSNADILSEMKKMLQANRKSEYDIVYCKAEVENDATWNRTEWTIRRDFEVDNDLAYSFHKIYDDILECTKIMHSVYEDYAVQAGIVKYYLERIEFDPCEDIFDIQLTTPVRESKSFMTEYKGKVIDGFSTVINAYQSTGYDITSTEIRTETIKAKNPSVFITSETILEDWDDKLDPNHFEYSQFFTVGKPSGCARSIFHGRDVIVRIYYVSPCVYVVKPLDIYLKDEQTDHLILVVEDDGSYTFFDNTKSVVAKVYKRDEDYHVLIVYRMKELAPFIASVEELIFDPDENRETLECDEDEKCLKSMNEKIAIAKELMGNWFGDDLSLLHSPTADLYSFIQRYFPDVIKTNESLNKAEFIDEVLFVQDINNRCFGIDSAKKRISADCDNMQSKQMKISDYL